MTDTLGGTWVPDHGILRWTDTVTPDELATLRRDRKPRLAFDPNLIACECGATVTQTCRTAGGNPTTHAYRVVSRRCLCGAVLEPRKQYCEPCRIKARRRTWNSRERRQPTATRRAAA